VPGVDGKVNGTVALVRPSAGFTCVPLRYCHCTAVPLVVYKPTQSPALPGPLTTVAITVPPAVPLVALSVTLGTVGVIEPLVATKTYVALKNRASYIPGVAGSVNITVSLGRPLAGRLCEPLRYCHTTAVPPAS